MKKAKHLILGVSLLSMIALVAVGCGSTPAAAPKTEPAAPTTATTPAPVAKVSVATYVGDDTCKACHDGKVTAFHTTEHSKALRPLSDFALTEAPGKISVFDGADDKNLKATELDLAKAKVFGVMMNEYVMAEVPGFKAKVYRVAKLEKDGDKFKLDAAKSVDVDKDGKEDWLAKDGSSCANCHAPGAPVASPSPGISCESCHGAGSNHVAAPIEKKIGTIVAQQSSLLPTSETCLKCHTTNPSMNDKGVLIANNHQGTRDYFASKHATSGQLNGCLTCHGAHKANAEGVLIRKDKAADICITCHADKNYDPAKIMWKNTTDKHGHITADHSFTAMPYEDLGDDKATKEIEITNTKLVDLAKKALPELTKK